MQKIVLSGISLFSGGTLSIYKDMLDELLVEEVYKDFCIVCFVHRKELFEKYQQYFDIIELPKARSNYFVRMYYEDYYFKKYSENNDVFAWISVKDITPNVKTQKLFTYCHNPMMFYKVDKNEIKYSKKLTAFSLLYKYVYKHNIKKNTYVIVQQDWIRQRFKSIFSINNILVARPIIKDIVFDKTECENNGDTEKVFTFIYPSQATFFKNFEVVCEATKILEDEGITSFQTQITLDGTENLYSKDLYNKYKSVKSLCWLGFLKRDDLFNYYIKSDCLVFPSRLETWGLPISEYKCTGKPIILSDLPYAHETVVSYEKVLFFNEQDAKQLAELMKELINKNLKFSKIDEKTIEYPFVNNWMEFWKFVISENT